MTSSTKRPARRGHIVMLGTALETPGGITAVIRSYRDGGLFARWPVRLLATFRHDRAADKLLTAARALLVFCGWLLRGEVAAVHAHTAARASFWRKAVFLLLGRLFGARAILHLHDGSFPHYYERVCGPAARRAIRYVLARMDQVLVLTPGWADYLRGVEPRARVRVLGNFVVPLSQPRAPRAGHILFMGRLWRDKGIFDLIDAAAEVVRRHPHVRFVCAGDGDLAALRALIAERGLSEHFVLPGWVDGAAKAALQAEAELFVLPSYYEGLPVGVLEAMANGIPVVATDVGGIAEAMDGEAGLLIAPGAPQQLAQALLRLLDDPALCAAMGAAGRRRAAAVYSEAAVLGALSALYAELGLLPVVAAAGGSLEMD